jgi:uncharacterized protein YgiM (DUF1202 family)
LIKKHLSGLVTALLAAALIISGCSSYSATTAPAESSTSAAAPAAAGDTSESAAPASDETNATDGACRTEETEDQSTAENAEAAATDEQTERTATIVTGSGRLRVRSGPGADYDIVAYLNNGDTVTVLSVEGDWAQIRTADGQEGYVSTEFLQMEEADAADTAATAEDASEADTAEQAEAAGTAEEAAAADTGAQAEGERSAVVSTSNGRLRVRSGPGADYDIVAYLNDGDTVTVLSVEGDWAKIRTADGQEGYTSAEYLIIEEAPAAEAATEAESEASAEAGTAAEQEAEGTAVISTESGRLRVRSGPGANYDIVAYLYNGDTVTVLSIDGDWAKIRTENGEEGYVSVSFLNMTESTESTETAAEEEEQEAAEPAEEEQQEAAEPAEEEQQEAVEPAEEETADSGATEEISAAASRYSVYAGAVFDELNNVRAEAHEDGSYYYEDLTGDGMTVVNSAYAGRLTYQENAADGATGEAAAAEPADTSEEAAEGATENTDSISLVSAYLTSVLSGNGMTEISDMTVEKSETIEENIPDEAKAEAWTASWTMKADGSAKTCCGAVICTETFTYVYYLSVDSDQAEAAQEKCAEIINGLTLMDGEG